MRAASALLETQRRFLAALYDDAEAGPTAAVAGNGLAGAARLRIYRHSCHEIQAGALRITYPAVLALTGADWFDQVARSYRRAWPSRGGNLQAFGGHFADHLAALPATHSLPYLPDVARLEWLRQESALAGAPAIRRPAANGGGGLHPGVRLLSSPHPVLTIWRYAMAPTAGRLRLPDGGEQVVLWREDGQVAMATVDSASFACIAALARGGTPDEAGAAGRAWDHRFDLAACVDSLVVRGLLDPSATHIFCRRTSPCPSPAP